MSNMIYIFAAFALIWAGTLAYLFRLASLRKQLEERISRLEDRTAVRDLMMPRRFLLIIVAIAIVAGCSRGDSGESLSRGAPDFRLPAVDGSMVKMSDYSGKVILVDFWATWCPPCNDMIPILSKLHKNYSDKGLVILGISLDQDGLGALGTFVHENMIPYKVIMGDKRISNSFGGVSSIPTLYMVDRDGRLVRKLTGFHSYAQLEEQVKKYL